MVQFAVKLLAVTLVAFSALGAAGVGVAVAVAEGVAVAVAVAVGVAVGVGVAAGNWNLPMRVNQLALLVTG